MSELNDHPPVKITNKNAYDFQLELDTTNFGKYVENGVVENVKVPFDVCYHSLAESVQNPGASQRDGFLMPLDMRFFDRPGQLHAAIRGCLRAVPWASINPGADRAVIDGALIRDLPFNLCPPPSSRPTCVSPFSQPHRALLDGSYHRHGIVVAVVP